MNNNTKSKPAFVVVFGPTASGKSALATLLASNLQSCVINADSRQYFQEFPILCAHPTPEETSAIPHHLYAQQSWSQGPINAALWATTAAQLIDKYSQANKVPVFVGGTGFYFKTLIGGLSPIPKINKYILEFLKHLAHVPYGTLLMYKTLKIFDKNFQAHPHNTHRIIRGLSILLSTGKSPHYWHQKEPIFFTKHKAFVINIAPKKPILDQNIANRAQQMISTGLVEETKNAQLSLPIIGLSAMRKFHQNKISIEQALEEIIIETRQYAKRQLSFGRLHIESNMTWQNVFTKEDWSSFQKEFQSAFHGAVGEN